MPSYSHAAARPSTVCHKPLGLLQDGIIIRALHDDFLSVRGKDDIAVHRGNADGIARAIIDGKTRDVNFIGIGSPAFDGDLHGVLTFVDGRILVAAAATAHANHFGLNDGKQSFTARSFTTVMPRFIDVDFGEGVILDERFFASGFEVAGKEVMVVALGE